MPQVVLDWLMTGDESIRDRARAIIHTDARVWDWDSAWNSARADFNTLIYGTFEDWI
jgi:hypothetical protein